jgi:hypothetical protein
MTPKSRPHLAPRSKPLSPPKLRLKGSRISVSAPDEMRRADNVP